MGLHNPCFSGCLSLSSRRKAKDIHIASLVSHSLESLNQAVRFQGERSNADATRDGNTGPISDQAAKDLRLSHV